MFRREHGDRPTIWLGVLMPVCQMAVKHRIGGVSVRG